VLKGLARGTRERVLTGTRCVQRLGYGVVNLEEEAKKDDENIEELENAQVREYPRSTFSSSPRVPLGFPVEHSLE
jgi:hypothetical protein